MSVMSAKERGLGEKGAGGGAVTSLSREQAGYIHYHSRAEGRIYALVTRGAGGHFPRWKFAKKVDKFWHQHQLAGWLGGGQVQAPQVGKA